MGGDIAAARGQAWVRLQGFIIGAWCYWAPARPARGTGWDPAGTWCGHLIHAIVISDAATIFCSASLPLCAPE